jgi:competence ComEA-like helix-hairpin-helix protein
VKQNLPPAKFQSSLIAALVILATILLASACATIPRPTISAARLSPNSQRAERSSAININTASPRELERLPGVGEGIAERIVTHRQQYGPFRRPEHLMMVRGISDRKFRELRSMIVVE